MKYLTPAGLRHENGGFNLLAQYGPELAVEIHEHTAHAALMKRLDGPRSLDLMLKGDDTTPFNVQLSLTSALLGKDIPHSNQTDFTALMAAALRRQICDTPDWAADVIQSAQTITRALCDDRSGWRVLHGDLHPRNIMKHQGTWLAIDARAIFGPPAFDYANLFINPWDHPDVIFRPGRMAFVADAVSAALSTGRQQVITCAIANALYNADIQLSLGRGRYPIKCLRQLLDMLRT